MPDPINRKLVPVEVYDEGVVLIPFRCQIDGTSTPDNLKGGLVASVARTLAGVFTFTLRVRPALILGGFAAVEETASNVDIYAQVDTLLTVSAGTFVVHCKTAGTDTDPSNNAFLSGFLIAKKTTRVQ